MKRGQALVELALCIPILLALALGVTGAGELADARSGLDAASRAAAAAGARAASPAGAQRAATRAFDEVVAAYRLGSPTVRVDAGAFSRTGWITVDAEAQVELDWAGLLPLPARLTISAHSVAPLEPWRSHRGPP